MKEKVDMKPEELEQLLYEEESVTLDFKRDQYIFDNQRKKESSELLKDILGFVNGWRRSEAYILIGINEVQGGRSEVYGIKDHLKEPSLQQFVNSRTNQPVQFSYETCELEEKQVGIIRIELQQRPIFLNKDYGRLEKNKVYIRRGSSIDISKPAAPDEIAKMGESSQPASEEASLAIEFAEIESENSSGTQMDCNVELCQVPHTDEIPSYEIKNELKYNSLPGGHRTLDLSATMSSHFYNAQLNPSYYRQLAKYLFFNRFTQKCRLMVENTGKVPANDVRVEISIQRGNGFGIFDIDECSEKPKKHLDDACSLDLVKRIRPSNPSAGYMDITKGEDQFNAVIDCGDLQPGRKVWGNQFYIGFAESGEYHITGKLFASNLSQPKEFTLQANADVTQTCMTIDELVALGEPHETDDD